MHSIAFLAPAYLCYKKAFWLQGRVGAFEIIYKALPFLEFRNLVEMAFVACSRTTRGTGDWNVTDLYRKNVPLSNLLDAIVIV